MITQILAHFALVAFVMVPFEHLTVLRRFQAPWRPQVWLDLVYAVVNAFLVPAGVAGLLALMAAACQTVIPGNLRTGIGALPLWLAAPLAILLADLGFYAAHRAFHHVPSLWRLHAVHHSLEHLDWLAAHRVHPIDQILTKSASMAPLLLLGFSAPAIGVFVVVYQWHSLLVHANTRIRFGWLERILASPRFHHWHHANQPEAFDRNFAGQLSVLDWVFGTLYLPRNGYPARYGTDHPLPATYLEQLSQPFLPATALTPAGVPSPPLEPESAALLTPAEPSRPIP